MWNTSGIHVVYSKFIHTSRPACRFLRHHSPHSAVIDARPPKTKGFQLTLDILSCLGRVTVEQLRGTNTTFSDNIPQEQLPPVPDCLPVCRMIFRYSSSCLLEEVAPPPPAVSRLHWTRPLPVTWQPHETGEGCKKLFKLVCSILTQIENIIWVRNALYPLCSSIWKNLSL